MNSQLEAALIEAALKVGIPIAVELAESLAGAIVALLGNIGKEQISGDALLVAVRVVSEIDRDYPEEPGYEKMGRALHRLRTYLHPDPSESTCNALLELAVQRVKAG